MSYHSDIDYSTNHLYVHRASITVKGSTQISVPPNPVGTNVGIYLGFRLKATKPFMPSFGVILLRSYTGTWNWSSSYIFRVSACTSAPTTGTGPDDGQMFSDGTTIFDMNSVTFNAGDSNSQIPPQIGCGLTTKNSISLTQTIPAGSYILLRNSSVSLPADTCTINLFLKGYYLDV